MIKISAPAKINLCLDIIKKSPTGYHEIRTVFREVPEVYDKLEIHETKESDHVSIRYEGENARSKKTVCISQKQNLVQKALDLLKKEKGIKKNAEIRIYKRIPIASGLGGASSDAAATLKGLNTLWGLGLKTNELLRLAFKLGADVPFFILGGTALGEHYGEKLTPLKSIKCVKFKIDPRDYWATLPRDFSDGEKASSKTARMYEMLDLSKCGKNTEKTKLLLEGIENENAPQIMKNLHNDFETLLAVKRGRHLSGSGRATFSVD